jgi:hypothetical protein
MKPHKLFECVTFVSKNNSIMQSTNARNVKRINQASRKPRKQRMPKRIPYATMAKQVYGDVLPYMKSLKNLLNVEDKYVDVANTAGFSSTATLILLNGVLQDDTENGRVGISIKSVSLDFNMTLTINSSATATYVRMFIVRDEQPNGAAFTYGTFVSSQTDVRTLTNVNFEQRFYTYADELFALNSNGQQNQVFRTRIPINFHTYFDDSDVGDVTDISKNSLYLVLVSNEATNTPTIGYYSRYWFVDN